RTSDLIERCSLRAYGGVRSSGLRLESGSASSAVSLDSEATISGDRLTIHTGWPRHSTVFFSPTFRSEMSTSTAAPAALARSDGAKVLTNGTAVAMPAPAPATHVMATHLRLLSSIPSCTTTLSLMSILELKFQFRATPLSLACATARS